MQAEARQATRVSLLVERGPHVLNTCVCKRREDTGAVWRDPDSDAWGARCVRRTEGGRSWMKMVKARASLGCRFTIKTQAHMDSKLNIYFFIFFILFIFVFLPFLGPLSRHMEVPRTGVKLQL